MTDTSGLNAFDEATRKLVLIETGQFRARPGNNSPDEWKGREAAAQYLAIRARGGPSAYGQRRKLQIKFGLTRGQMHYWLGVLRRERADAPSL